MRQMRVVVQHDVWGKKLREFPSVRDAARHVGGFAPNIWKCCNGDCPTAYGFKWKFKDGNDSTISDGEYSMILERAYGEVTNIIVEYKARLKAKRMECLENGEKEPYHLRMVLDSLDNLAREYRKRSDEYFLKSKDNAELDRAGVENLANAIIERMALDYETAICEKDEGTINEIRNFAEKKAYLYTNLNAEDILSRIAVAHKKFCEIARENIKDILQVTETFRKKRDAFSEKNNPYRCPLCGGGMYVKTKYKSNSYLVGCTGCALTEVVTIRS